MLYLINETFYDKESKEVIDLLKIGYTSESSKPGSRFLSYLQHCPEAKLLYEIPGGTLFHESALLDKFHHLLYCGNEWFKYDQEIIDYFDNHRTLESLDDLVTPDLVSYVDIKNYCIKCLDLLLNSRIESGDITLQQAINTQSSMLDVLLKLRFKNFQQVDKHFLHLFEFDVHKGEVVNSGVSEFLRDFDSLSQFTEKMKLLCEKSDSFTENELNCILGGIPIIYKNYFMSLGKERIRALQYRKYALEDEYQRCYENQTKIEDLDSLVFSSFIVGNRYTKVSVKQELLSIYTKLGIKLSPKASDLEKYFELKSTQIVNKETGKRDHGYLILSKKKK